MTERPRFRLVDHLQGLVHDLAPGCSSIGRSEYKNEISVAHASVSSGRHAEVVVTGDSVEVIDLLSANGTLVNGVSVERASVLPGDTFTLAVASFTLLTAQELQAELPVKLIVSPCTGPEVDRLWHARAPLAGENDELWAALYLRWRDTQVARAPMFVEPLGESAWWVDDVWTEPSDPRWRNLPNGESAWPIRAAGKMCSAPMLRHLRNAYFRADRFQWFVLEERAFVEMLTVAEHGVGSLFACDIAMNHPSADRRDLALDLLRRAATDVDPATYVLRRVPANATSVMDLVGHAFALAHRDGTTWSGSEFLSFMQYPSVAEAAERIVFAARDADGRVVETFRALDHELITLDNTLTSRIGHHVSVANAEELDERTRRQWVTHLAEFEVIQPFEQFT